MTISYDLSKLNQRVTTSLALSATGIAATFVAPATLAATSAIALGQFFQGMLGADVHAMLTKRKPRPSELIRNGDIQKVIAISVCDTINLVREQQNLRRGQRSCLKQLAKYAKEEWSTLVFVPSMQADLEPVMAKNLLSLLKRPVIGKRTSVGLHPAAWSRTLEAVADFKKLECISRDKDVLRLASEGLTRNFEKLLRENLKEDYAKGGKAFAGVHLFFMAEVLGQFSTLSAGQKLLKKGQLDILEGVLQRLDQFERKIGPRIGRATTKNHATLVANIDKAFALFDRKLKRLMEHQEQLATTITSKARGFSTLQNRTVKLRTFAQAVRHSPIRVPKPSKGAPFVGRGRYIEKINSLCRNKTPAIVYLHGFGGIGKSTILWHWLLSQQQANFTGFRHSFNWSFYGQGQGQSGTASLPFFEKLTDHLVSLGYSHLRKIDANRRGEELARAWAMSDGLLVLDGIETLQHPLEIKDGEIRDRELADFLLALRGASWKPGQPSWKVVISSRWLVPHLDSEWLQPIPVKPLSDQEGGELLQKFQYKENGQVRRLFYNPPKGMLPQRTKIKKAERIAFVRAAKAYRGQPLALVLLASYLIEKHGGNLDLRMSVVKILRTTKKDRPSRHAQRILRYFVRLLNKQAASSDKDVAQLATNCRKVLFLISLFDRPVSDDMIDFLISASPIKGLTDKLGLSEVIEAIENLSRLQLTTSGPEGLDCHPLIREHMGEICKKENSPGWASAQKKLFLFMQSEEHDLEDSERADSLARAIYHGCKAKEEAKAFRLYETHFIGSSDGRDAWKKVASRGDDLAVLSNFYAKQWAKPLSGLSNCQKGELLNETGYDLWKLCRSAEAVTAFRAATIIWRGESDYRREARDLVLLGKANLSLGKIDTAARYAKKAVKVAEQGYNEVFKAYGKTKPKTKGVAADRTIEMLKQKINALSFLGEVYHQLAKWDKAESSFLNARLLEDKVYELTGKRDIYAVRVVQSASFYIDQGEHDRALQRLEEAQKICSKSPDQWQVDIAFNDLWLGLTYYQLATEGDEFNEELLMRCRRSLHAAHTASWALDLLDCRIATYLLSARVSDLLGRQEAWLLSTKNALNLAERNDFRRVVVDCHLELCRYYLHNKQSAKAKELLIVTAREIGKQSYYRRAEEALSLAGLTDNESQVQRLIYGH